MVLCVLQAITAGYRIFYLFICMHTIARGIIINIWRPVVPGGSSHKWKAIGELPIFLNNAHHDYHLYLQSLPFQTIQHAVTTMDSQMTVDGGLLVFILGQLKVSVQLIRKATPLNLNNNCLINVNSLTHYPASMYKRSSDQFVIADENM